MDLTYPNIVERCNQKYHTFYGNLDCDSKGRNSLQEVADLGKNKTQNWQNWTEEKSCQKACVPTIVFEKFSLEDMVF